MFEHMPRFFISPQKMFLHILLMGLIISMSAVTWAMANTELGITITKEGNGVVAKTGMMVDVHYVGSLEDGTQFDNSRDRGSPLRFVLGEGQVIPGWEQGIEGMKVGEQRTLVIPPHLAYGARGAGNVIPPQATLTFKVELMDARYPPTVDITIQKPGDGALAENGSTVDVHYVGTLEDGTEFDNSRKRGTPISFVLGMGQVIPGWEQGIEGMKVGEMRRLVIPSELAYGENGAGDSIPPNATLIFDVELMAVTQPARLQNLTGAELLEAQRAGDVIIDIRREEEWRETGIIEGAQTITAFDKEGRLQTDFRDAFLSLIPTKDTAFVLVCRTGSRTGRLGQALAEQLGYSQAKHLQGGIVEFQKEGFGLKKYP
ncbi:MAG: FKBP-type peptidyl-prolyl cis-trans isomerase [Alphaproteobacteria bacterium]